jgi:hypothetical protein
LMADGLHGIFAVKYGLYAVFLGPRGDCIRSVHRMRGTGVPEIGDVDLQAWKFVLHHRCGEVWRRKDQSAVQAVQWRSDESSFGAVLQYFLVPP